MGASYGARDIVRNPSLLRINPDESFIVEDKKAHTTLGVYLGVDLAAEFFAYTKQQALLKSAEKIKNSTDEETKALEGTLSDGL